MLAFHECAAPQDASAWMSSLNRLCFSRHQPSRKTPVRGDRRQDTQNLRRRLLAELRDAMSEPRYLAVRCVAMDHALLRGAHDLRLGGLERGESRPLIAGGDRLLDLAHRGTHARTARGIDFSPARDDARGFAGGRSVGHCLSVVRAAPGATAVLHGEKVRAAKAFAAGWAGL